jgi:CHAD domain-containing protein
MVTESREVERKYDIELGRPLPSLVEADGAMTLTEPVEIQLEAVYFDTPDLRLARRGTTLRRRTGGEDEGWHLKLPAGGDARTELRVPMDAARESVPDQLVREVRVLARNRPLVPVAIIRTDRTERRLLDARGRGLAVIADDTVHAERLGESATVTTWREVEVELVDGETALLDTLQSRLSSAGLHRSAAASKLARVLDDEVLASPRAPLTPQSPAGTVAIRHLQEQTDELIVRDRGARVDEPDAVHKMRVATRRLRSALATYRQLFDPQRTEPLRQELAWLGTALGKPRDAEVLRDRLRAHVAELADELILGPVIARIDTELNARHRVAHAELVQTMDDDRYLRLLDQLDDLVAHPPFTDRAQRPARRELPRLVARACTRVDRAAAAAEQAETASDRALRLHDVRKAAKRARYAAESVAGVFGKPAVRLATRMENLQEILGEHQDSVVARQVIRELAAAAAGAGENGFTFGLLYAREANIAESAQRAYQPALRAASSKRARRWLQRRNR